MTIQEVEDAIYNKKTIYAMDYSGIYTINFFDVYYTYKLDRLHNLLCEMQGNEEWNWFLLSNLYSTKYEANKKLEEFYA